MGAIKKWVGDDVYKTLFDPLADLRDGPKRAAEETARAAEKQAEAIRASSERAAKAATETAAQTARQQEQAAARNAAEGAAADALNKPLENADVQIGGPVNTGQSSSAASRKRRQTFGVGSSGSGVQI